MILYYKPKLKLYSRQLRSSLTDAEILLWSHIRRKQLCNIQFYRQKPIGNYIVDFYAPTARLIIEVDGGQHFDDAYKRRDNSVMLILQRLA
jgi:very-short-patch-repair endonuclease